MKQAITGYITAVINNYTRAIENLRQNKVDNMIIRRYKTIREELSDLLDFVEDIPEERKEPVAIVLSERDCKCEKYKQALGKVLSNLRSIDGPNPADSYINESIEIIKKMVEETR